MTTKTTLRSPAAALALACAAAACAALPAAAAAQAQAPARATPIPEGLTAQEKELLALGYDFSRRCAEALEKWLAAKEVTEERLFAFLYYPIPRTDPPKFTTDYDKLSDRDVQGIEESVLARSPAILYTVLVDRHGYLPTHNQRYSKPLTGDRAADLLNNRTKRIFNDRTGLAAARSPLSGFE